MPLSFSRTVASAASDTPPAFSGKGAGMALSHLAATTGHTLSGTPKNTKPLPLRTAASAAK